MFKRVLNFLLYGGSTRLRTYEQQLMALAKDALPSAEQSVFGEQLARVQRIKRYNDDRMVTFQFDGIDTAMFADRSPELPLVSFEVDGGKQRRILASLIAHRGRIHSLEFKTKPASISADRWSQVVAQYRGRNLQIASDIDREEHG